MLKTLDKWFSKPEIKLNILKQTMWENDESIVNDEGRCEL